LFRIDLKIKPYSIMAVLLPFYLRMDPNSVTTDKPLDEVVRTIDMLLEQSGIYSQHEKYFWNYKDTTDGEYQIRVYVTENKQHIVEPRSLTRYTSEEFRFLVRELHKILG